MLIIVLWRLRQQEWCENLRAMHWLMCKYFDFFVLFATVDLTNLFWGGIDIWKNFAQAEHGDRRRCRTNSSWFWLIFWTYGLWRVRGRLLSTAASNATVILSKQVTGGVGEHLCEGQFYLTRSQAFAGTGWYQQRLFFFWVKSKLFKAAFSYSELGLNAPP